MTQTIHFGPFSLDPASEQLRRGAEVISLRPKGLKVLRRLVDSRGALVTFDQLFDFAWPDVAVTPNTLTNIIAELRSALGDDRLSPRFIETVHRRGYRFIGKVNDADTDAAPATIHVGRDAELKELKRAWQGACRGERQVVLIRGEAGIGKTALVDRFLRVTGTETAAPFLLARAHCLEQEGGREPYMPILEALEQLGAGPQREHLTALLRQYAPTWLVQLPWLLPEEEMRALQRGMRGTGAVRMLREGAALLEALSRETPLILVIEDLHWADPGTVDWITAVAQRAGRACLLLIGTYRQADAVVHQQRIAAVAPRLRQQQRCIDLTIAPFALTEIAAYLEQRLASSRLPPSLGPLINRHSGGNPLFVSALTSHMIDQGWLAQGETGWGIAHGLADHDPGLPDDLRATIEAQLTLLSPRLLEVLETASVEGREFTAQAVALALACGKDEIEALCHGAAAHGQFIREATALDWPDGTRQSRYAFIHALFERTLCQRIAPARLRLLHQRIGEALEQGYGERAGEIAGSLAVHFEAADDSHRAEHYRGLAAAVAGRRFAYRDAATHLEAALKHLAKLPEGPERQRREALLQLSLGNALLAGRDRVGFDDVRQAYARAESAARGCGAHHEQFRALLGLGAVCRRDGDARGFLAIAAQQMEMAKHRVPELSAQAYSRSGEAHALAGNFRQARIDLERSARLDPYPGVPILTDIRATTQLDLAFVLTHQGLLEEADRAKARGLARSAEIGLFAQSDVSSRAIDLHVLRRDLDAALAWSNELAAVAEQSGIQIFQDAAQLHGDWARCLKNPGAGVLARMRATLARCHSVGEHWQDTTHFGEIAAACLCCGDVPGALESIERGLAHADAKGEQRDVVELWRLRGEVRLEQGDEGLAAADFRHAIDLAREQGSRLLELRVTTSFSRLLIRQRKARQARTLLRAACAGFGESVDITDLREARALLGKLEAR